ncbi:TPA: hypothetical protein NJV68_001853 [Corynebacterium striatum]|uniref:hypothetical protein n=1 Tax=Corynebacterium striatum TaxID=43770 RepID=UPI001A1CB013|nr:hypothetical protein [Corynebacterium striatum]HAT6525855.1 hypothetical protein [Corynebacterium striatum]HAT6563987.1 hypothetical protein [Corynebacterium striatum]HAT6569339.1 hypothetical protein [Corynebacterium striatum]HCG2976566.1 hypothetical protein [Corynebacterium striatum]
MAKVKVTVSRGWLKRYNATKARKRNKTNETKELLAKFNAARDALYASDDMPQLATVSAAQLIALSNRREQRKQV